MKEFKIRVLDSEFCDLDCKLLYVGSRVHCVDTAPGSIDTSASNNCLVIHYQCGLDENGYLKGEHIAGHLNVHRCDKCKEFSRFDKNGKEPE